MKIAFIPGDGRGNWPWKGIWGWAALKTPFSRLSCSSQGSHFKQRVSSQDPPLRKFEILASTASIFAKKISSQAPKFGHFQLTSPQIGNFQLTSPLFQRQISVCKPHTLEIRGYTSLPGKKGECPPGFHFIVKWFQCNSYGENVLLRGETYKRCKLKLWKFWECPLFETREYIFKSGL